MLSLKQLHHFWLTAHAGGVTRAAEASGLAPQTISAQIAALEQHLGKTLFRRNGRSLELTPTGQVALRYADAIFALVQEFESALAQQQPVISLRVGLSDSVPKKIAALLLRPLQTARSRYRLWVIEERLPRLLGELAAGKLDFVLSDTPPPETSGLRLAARCLLDVPLAWFGAPSYGPGPISWSDLGRLPLLLPAEDTFARAALLAQLEQHGVTPTIAGEFADSALIVEMARDEMGIFAAPETLETALTHDGRLMKLGEIPELHERYWVMTLPQKARSPALDAIAGIEV